MEEYYSKEVADRTEASMKTKGTIIISTSSIDCPKIREMLNGLLAAVGGDEDDRDIYHFPFWDMAGLLTAHLKIMEAVGDAELQELCGQFLDEHPERGDHNYHRDREVRK